jgi:methylmalonyl-CoA mutase cobalamin-binding subunit
MQFLINAGYGVAVAVGLYFFGIPSAIMWGVLGFTLRFLPYLGPWLAAVLPILVSLAVSDGWTTPILVACMYAVYELILNNVAEPMLYGSSTGVSTVGVIISAIFWTWLWGPIGLILAMPMTVCLVVMARHVPQLRFITVLLADQATLSPAQRVYQRLLAFDYDEPLKLAHQHLKSAPLVTFYEDVLIPALSLAECDRQDGVLSEEQESFVREAAEDLVEELGASDFAVHTADDADDGSSVEPTRKIREAPATRVLCIPLQDAADETTSRMLAQLLVADGFEVDSSPAGTLTSEMVDRVAASDSNIVVISILPPIRPRDSRLLWKRLRTRYPHLPIVVGYWVGPNATESLLPPRGDETSRVATSLSDAVALVRSTAAKLESTKAVPA